MCDLVWYNHFPMFVLFMNSRDEGTKKRKKKDILFLQEIVVAFINV